MTPLYYSRPERWPQVSLRGLLVIVTLAALLMPWAMAEYKALKERERMWRKPYLRLKSIPPQSMGQFELKSSPPAAQH